HWSLPGRPISRYSHQGRPPEPQSSDLFIAIGQTLPSTKDGVGNSRGGEYEEACVFSTPALALCAAAFGRFLEVAAHLCRHEVFSQGRAGHQLAGVTTMCI
ncbi:hypothetical protein, partial [Sinorhizobium americanum]|uniref:hypothetical protein n=1 Tax=Sinorhizobium americanum TaxID=194963 RepID=UPI001A7E094B